MSYWRPSPSLMCRCRLPSAPRVRTGTTTSLCPRMETCRPPRVEEEAGLRPSAPLRSGEGVAWCEWSQRERPGPSMTPWWPPPPRALPAQTRAPPTARTLTLPSSTPMTCERANQPSLSSSNTCIISHSEKVIQKKKKKNWLGIRGWNPQFLVEHCWSCCWQKNCTCGLWHFLSHIPYTLSLYLSSVPLESCLSWCCMLSHLPNACLLTMLGPVTHDI